MKRILITLLLTFLPFFEDNFHAKEPAIPEGMTGEQLEKAVIRRADYINNRLLSDETTKEIQASGNQKAISILKQVMIDKKKVDELIKKRKFRDAFIALHHLNNSIMESIKLITAKERGEKKIKDDLETARVSNDAYISLAIKRDLEGGVAGREGIELFKKAKETRTEAVRYQEEEKFSKALDSYNKSNRLLKKAIALAKKKKTTAAAQDIREEKDEGLKSSKARYNAARDRNERDIRNAYSVIKDKIRLALDAIEKAGRIREDSGISADRGRYEQALREIRLSTEMAKKAQTIMGAQP